jgi:pimeloyl-ACP methyl ester carboxylesterase
MARQIHGAALAGLIESRQDLEYGWTSPGLRPRRRCKLFELLVDVIHRHDSGIAARRRLASVTWPATMIQQSGQNRKPSLSKPGFLRRARGSRLAYRRLPGAAPGVLFCGGYTSDMTGTKATALERFCRDHGRACTRFDYSGHGASSGEFADGTIGEWAEDALAILDRATAGPIVLVGSSMGGWIMLLVALARPERVRGLIGIAAAPDFTEDLLLPQATPAQRRALADQGYWMQASAYGQSYPVTRRLIEEARAQLVLRGPIPIWCPVHLLHGQRDPDVPWQTALRLAERLESDDVTIELIKAGDHRLSSEHDLARLMGAVQRIAESTPAD